jgi:hypothetical protein
MNVRQCANARGYYALPHRSDHSLILDVLLLLDDLRLLLAGRRLLLGRTSSIISSALDGLLLLARCSLLLGRSFGVAVNLALGFGLGLALLGRLGLLCGLTATKDLPVLDLLDVVFVLLLQAPEELLARDDGAAGGDGRILRRLLVGCCVRKRASTYADLGFDFAFVLAEHDEVCDLC